MSLNHRLRPSCVADRRRIAPVAGSYERCMCVVCGLLFFMKPVPGPLPALVHTVFLHRFGRSTSRATTRIVHACPVLGAARWRVWILRGFCAAAVASSRRSISCRKAPQVRFKFCGFISDLVTRVARYAPSLSLDSCLPQKTFYFLLSWGRPNALSLACFFCSHRSRISTSNTSTFSNGN